MFLKKDYFAIITGGTTQVPPGEHDVNGAAHMTTHAVNRGPLLTYINVCSIAFRLVVSLPINVKSRIRWTWLGSASPTLISSSHLDVVNVAVKILKKAPTLRRRGEWVMPPPIPNN